MILSSNPPQDSTSQVPGPSMNGQGQPGPMNGQNPPAAPNGQGQPPGNSMPDNSIQEDPQAAQTLEGGMVKNVKLGPPQEAQLEAYKDNATIVIFSKKTQPGILQSLQSGETPTDSIAKTANSINDQLEPMLEKKGEKMTEITLCLGAAHLVSELIVLAEAAKLYTLNNDERLEAFRQTIQDYFAKGLQNGTIDPVELQKNIEPLMTDKQKQFGLQAMQQHGLLKTAPPSQSTLKGDDNGV